MLKVFRSISLFFAKIYDFQSKQLTGGERVVEESLILVFDLNLKIGLAGHRNTTQEKFHTKSRPLCNAEN